GCLCSAGPWRSRLGAYGFHGASGVRRRKVSGSVDSPIPIVRAAAGIDVELFARADDLPPQVPVLQLAERIDAGAPEIQVRDQQPTEMGGVGDAAVRAGYRRVERERPHDQDE